METNWNQLIERYLQNELSEEGKTAFEQELHVNSELREELEMHQLIQSAAKRASQRMVIKQTAKSHFRNLRIKQFTIGVVVTAAATVGIIYWVESKKQPEATKPNRESVLENKQEREEAVHMSAAAEEELISLRDTIINQPTQPGDKSSLIQSSDWKTMDERSTQSKFSLDLSKRTATANTKNGKDASITGNVKTNHTKLQLDTVALSRTTPIGAVGYTNEKLDGQVIQDDYGKSIDSRRKNSSIIGAAWNLEYDSVGHFNDLYCGYALVMNDAKFGFVDRKGNIFIPLIYDKIVITSNLQSSRDKTRRKDKKVLYIPKRSGGEVQYCDEQVEKPSTEPIPENKKRK